MFKLVNWFYPKSLDSQNLESVQRGGIVVGLTLALVGFIPGFIILYYLLGNTGAMLVEIIAMGVASVYLLLVRRFGFSNITIHCGLLTMLLVFLGVAYFTGGSRSPGLLWIAIIPYAALNVLARKPSLVWALLSLAILVIIHSLWFMGITLGNQLEPEKIIIQEVITSVGIAITLFFLGWMAISGERRANKVIAMQSAKSQLIRKAIDKSGDAFILFDSDGVHYYQNRVLNDLLEIDESESLDQNRFVELFADQTKVKQTLLSAQNGKPWSEELEIVTKNARRVPVLFRTNGVIDKSGRCQALIVILTDITKQKEVERVLRESEKKYRLVAENSTDAIWLRDMNLDLVYISPSIEKMRGFTPQELMALPMEKNLTPDSLLYISKKLEVELEQALENPDWEVILEVENYCKDGSTIWVEDSIKFLTDEQGTPIQLIGTTRNITERKKAQEGLKAARSELIENAHRAGMADIAAGTLHNVGNLLNSVKTSAHSANERIVQSKVSELKNANQFLKKTFEKHTDFNGEDLKGDKIVEFYSILEEALSSEQDEIQEELKRLQEKIDSITDVIASQQRFAGFSGLSEYYSLEQLITDVLEIESPTLTSLGVHVMKNFEDIPNVSIQKTKLLHIMINLIKNAEEAVLDNPKDNRNITIKLEKRDTEVLIMVSDNGSGITEENKQKIFNHGFTTKSDGFGFGLHSCAIYMNDMKGKIWMHSEGFGKGTTFFLSLPLTTT